MNNGDMTFTTWVQHDSQDTKQYMIMSSSYGGWGVYFGEGANNNYIWFTEQGVNCCHSTASISDSNWYFVAVTLSDGTVSFYVNNQLVGTSPGSYSGPGTGDYYMGGAASFNPGDPATDLQGALDESLVFNMALTQAQVTELYNGGNGLYGVGNLPISQDGSPGLVAGYHFDEGSGTNVDDFSGNGNTAFIVGLGNGVSWGPGVVLATATFANNGTLTNSGNVFNYGVFDNALTASLSNGNYLENDYLLTNEGTATIGGSLVNYGTISNTGSIVISSGGSFNEWFFDTSVDGNVTDNGVLSLDAWAAGDCPVNFSGSGTLYCIAEGGASPTLTLTGDNSGFTGTFDLYCGWTKMGSPNGIGGAGRKRQRLGQYLGRRQLGSQRLQPDGELDQYRQLQRARYRDE